MKAIVIREFGSADVLRLGDKPIPKPASEEVLIKVFAAGVNRPDVAQRKGSYPPPPGAPVDVPGLEVAGVIEEVGPAVTRWKKGDAVCALIAGGGYAEYALANAGHCLPVPGDCTFAEACSFPETVFTVWHNVFQRGQLKRGERFLVHGGSSGIGITAIQLAKAFGSTVYATAGSNEKCDACISLGAERCINYKKEDFEEALKSEGADVILDMIGGDYIPKNIRLLKTEGRLVFINAMKGGESAFNVSDIMRRRLTITGSTLRNREPEFKTQLAAEIEKNVWPLIESKKLRPVIYKQFPLENAAQAHQLIESSEHIGKIVLINK
ncbi:NAD(P)H-quinone oxidoreductase [Segetibacter aerophilus]|uniref:NAD(P)H quinone oxidoreductase n=1 Tax=Segetibacter aerophilus TaxID=670293 RepID=A0A512B9E6_9BACT|nr:NAD(P)H-quinone oxidoreductase [Segetibacter aerophilus]GEO08584.1 NAD(P)H quinone oxidoreductase [Segetibacter aerophilus]